MSLESRIKWSSHRIVPGKMKHDVPANPRGCRDGQTWVDVRIRDQYRRLDEWCVVDKHS